VQRFIKKDLKITDFPLLKVNLKIEVVFHVSNMAKDVDNLLKFVLDALNTVVYEDDRHVHKIVGTKYHSPLRGYTTISIEPMTKVHRIE
jgi:Holliday junction resolvase RusA-like endonuclease